MKEKTAIVTDTNSGLSTAKAEEFGVYLVPMPVIIDGETYFENVSLSQETFFARLKQGADVSTSQPAPGDLMEIWEPLLEKYEKIVYIPMSSGLSSSYEIACMLAADYDGRVLVANNRRISVTLRQSVLDAKHLADQGTDAAEIAAYLEEDGLNSSIYVAVNTLEYLKRSGRVTAAGAAIGTLLNIKLVLQIQGGKLDAFRKARGMEAAMDCMVKGLLEDRKNRFADQKVTVRAAYSGDPAGGAAWREKLQAAFPDLSVALDQLPISIACHTGDGALGAGIMLDIL